VVGGVIEPPAAPPPQPLLPPQPLSGVFGIRIAVQVVLQLPV